MNKITQLTDDDLHSIFTDRGFDGRWSACTKLLLLAFRAKPEDLRLDLPWVITPQNFRCPVCRRSKVDIMSRYRLGILATLNIHHDHFFDAIHARMLVSPFGDFYHLVQKFTRFKPQILCCPCNQIDSRVKKKWPGIHRQYSFSPTYLSQIIKAVSNDRHRLDYDIAWQIWQEEAESFHACYAELDASLNQGGAVVPARLFRHHEGIYSEAKVRFYTTFSGESNDPSLYAAFVTRSMSIERHPEV